VLILPPGHADRLKLQRRLSSREKWILGSVLATVAAVIVAVVISIGTAGHQTGNGCVDVKFPITIGGEELYQCGAKARALCAAVGTPGGFTSVSGQAVAEQCRKAGLPVG
jgi:ABC-type Co2+ transport system permease subunit